MAVAAASTCFSDRMAEAIDRLGSPACVGLDPVIDKLPASLGGGVGITGGRAVAAIESFCLGVLDAIAGIVPVVKPQSACFERYGSEGMRVLEGVIRAARERGLIVVLDAKRGDIGVSAEHYAAAAFNSSAKVDALTISGYLGPDTITPFMRPGAGLFGSRFHALHAGPEPWEWQAFLQLGPSQGNPGDGAFLPLALMACPVSTGLPRCREPRAVDGPPSTVRTGQRSPGHTGRARRARSPGQSP